MSKRTQPVQPLPTAQTWLKYGWVLDKVLDKSSYRAELQTITELSRLYCVGCKGFEPLTR